MTIGQVKFVVYFAAIVIEGSDILKIVQKL
jgi:hypothetical protein